MAIKFIDILEPVNPEASAIAKSKQIAGARSVATRADLDTIIPQVLSASYNPADGSHENDAVGQVWYVANENKYYKLTEFSVDTSASPFTINRKWELFIDSSITGSAIDNRIDSMLKSGFATQTIFGYDTLTEQQISSNSIYIGGYGNYDGIMIQSNGKFFDFPTDNGGTIATLENIDDASDSINEAVDQKIQSLRNEIDGSITNVLEDTRDRLNEHINNNLIHVYKDYIGYTEYDMTTLYAEKINNKDNASVLGQTFTLKNLVGLNNGNYSNIETGAQYKIDGVTLQVRANLANFVNTIPGANVETYIQIFKQHLNSSNVVDGYTHLATSTNKIVWRDNNNILYSSEEKITWNFNQDVNGNDIIVGTDEQLVLLFNNSPTPNVSFINGTSFGDVANVSFPLRMVSTSNIEIAKNNLWWIDGYGNVKKYSDNTNAIILTIDSKKLESEPYIIVKTQNEDVLTKQTNDGTQLINKLSISEKIQSSAVATEPTDVPNLGKVQELISAIGDTGSGETRYTILNPELTVIDGVASWTNVIKYKNSNGVTGVDYTNVPLVQVYNKTNGFVCYPDVKLSSVVVNEQEYTSVDIIFKEKDSSVSPNKYVAVIIISAEVE